MDNNLRMIIFGLSLNVIVLGFFFYKESALCSVIGDSATL